MSTFWIVQLAVAPLAVYALYRYARLTRLRRRADRCAHEWAPSARDRSAHEPHTESPNDQS